MKDTHKRLFFGCGASGAWPNEIPSGRVLSPCSRHLTLAFLGDVDYKSLEPLLPSFPKPSFQVGPTGVFDRVVFLPEHRPHVAAWHVQWDLEGIVDQYQQSVSQWLRFHGYAVDERPFFPHVTIAREPFSKKKWLDDFMPLPMHINGLHLYESVGDLVYQSIWSYPLLSPFVELSHTADFAFLVQAESIQGVHLHANNALAFKFPPLLEYMQRIPLEANLDDIVIALNKAVAMCDSEIGCPLKAVSFHGDVHVEQGIHKWEMIVDV